MTRIKFDDQTFTSQNDETVLDTLLHNNVQVPYGCKQGVCFSCLMRSLDNAPPASSQVGLKDTQQKQNYFLSCLCKPENDMTVVLPNAESVWLDAEVIEKRNLSANVIFLKLKSKDPLAFFAGQFVNLRRDDGVTRSYSIANIHNPNHELEFHIRILPDGQFSRWVADELQIGMLLTFSHAQGSCHYIEGKEEQPLLLIGTGTGLAPLYGIIRDALSYKHHGEIHLYHGSRDESGLYFVEKLRELAKKYSNFHYTPCLSSSTDLSTDYAHGRVHEIALKECAKLDGWRVYLCGQPEMVKHAKKMAYLQGAALNSIYADPFTY